MEIMKNTFTDELNEKGFKDLNEILSHHEIQKVFINLLKEIPSDTIVDKSMSHSLNAEQMIRQISNNSDISKKFISNILRISRDLLINQINKVALDE